MSQFCVVIPAFNEQATIREIAQKVLEHTPHVIIVDDGSTDNTVDQILDLNVILIRKQNNSGKAAALQTGITRALELPITSIITIDADGQHKPEDIPRFLESAQHFPGQIIIGSRLADRSAIPTYRYLANRFANFWISWAAGYVIEDSQSGYRLYPASLFRNLVLNVSRNNSFVFESEILIEAARRNYIAQFIPIEAIYAPDSRTSHFRPVKDFLQITRMVAWKLIRRGLYPVGFHKAFIRPLYKKVRLQEMGIDGLLMLGLSLLLMVMSAGLSPGLLSWHTFRLARSTSDLAPDFDSLMILGMRLQNNRPSPDYLMRLERAYKLYQHNPQLPIMILGGYTGSATRSESMAGKQYLTDKGVPADQIQIEEGSRHTLENLKNACKMLDGNQRINLITSRYHLARCHYMATGFEINHALTGAEDKFSLTPTNVLRVIKEAFHSHWYLSGKLYSYLTNNRKILDRISNRE